MDKLQLIQKEFIKKFCNDHGGQKRLLRTTSSTWQIEDIQKFIVQSCIGYAKSVVLEHQDNDWKSDHEMIYNSAVTNVLLHIQADEDSITNQTKECSQVPHTQS